MKRASVAFALVLAGLAVGTGSGATFPPNISFASAPFSPVSIGDAPSGVKTGDFNGDGNLDLAYVNGRGNSAGILLGHGDGVFHSGPNSPRATDGTLSMDVGVGDFNGDGHLDLVATDLPGGLTGFWNVLTGSAGGNVSVFLGDGAGNLGSHIDSDAEGDFPIGLAVGDFNQDGKQDVAVANLSSDNVSILLGSGDGKFSLFAHASVGHHPTSVTVGDFNLDGKQDLAVTNASGNTVSILLGSGNGSFSAPHSAGVHSRPVASAVGDFNGDGKPDLAVVGQLSSNVSILLGDGAGSFTSNTRFGVARHPSGIVVGDFNNDGKRDLAVSNRMSDLVSVLLGTGTGIFEQFRNFAVQDQPIGLAAGQFDADGKLDLAVVNTGGDSISTLLNDTDLTPPTLTMPSLAPSYPYHASLTLTFSAEDTESGVESIEATLNGESVSNGQTVLLDHPGTNTFTLTATDKVGNTATQSATFAVLYNFTGYLPPVPIDATELGNPADSDNVFDYLSGADLYAYELDTTPFSRGTWQIQTRLDDGSIHAVVVGLK
jgi:hypothetical protein